MDVDKVISGKDLAIDSFHGLAAIASSSSSNCRDESTSRRTLLIIDDRALERQCLAYAISNHKKDIDVFSLGTIDEWHTGQEDLPQPSAVLLNIGGRQISDPSIESEIKTLCAGVGLPIILLADTDNISQIFIALECGVRGYIPSSVSLDVCVEAIALAIAGGIYVPVGSVLAMRGTLERSNTRPLSDIFTDRQLEVVEALRRGKANKIIAYELNMQESTVKVHVRNIMKKVKASNRTEVAYKIAELMPH